MLQLASQTSVPNDRGFLHANLYGDVDSRPLVLSESRIKFYVIVYN